MSHWLTSVRARIARVVTRLRGGEGSLLRGTALMGVAEMGNRVTRILTAVVLARVLTTVEFGVMALILTTYELVRMLIHNGLGARIVQAEDGELNEVCAAVNKINWIVGAIMCGAQLAVAWPIQYFFDAEVGAMLAVLALVHLIYPFGLARACIAMRDNRLGFIAAMMLFQISIDNIATAGLVYAGYGVWAAVFPKIAIAIIWVAVTLMKVKPVPLVAVSADKMRNVVAYGRNVLAAETLNTFRGNADKLIVGKALGMEAFGVYSFATNTGSGIATGLGTALGQAVLPYLSGSRRSDDMRERFALSVKAMSLVIMPLVTLQVVLAPWYVPLVFGGKWAPAVPALMLMCLGTLSRPLVVATSQLLRASGDVDLEWRISKYNAVLFICAIIGGLPYGVVGVAASLAMVNIIPAVIFAKVALDHATRERSLPPLKTLSEIPA